MENSRVFKMPFAKVYELLIQKVEKKGKTKPEADQIIYWLTGYDAYTLQQQLARGVDMETFFKQAPQIHPNASLITGLICGHRVEDIADETIRQIRYLDKLIDELAKGKKLEKILRK